MAVDPDEDISRVRNWVPVRQRGEEGLKITFYVFGGAEQECLGPTSGKCGELSLEGVFQNGRQNK